MVRRIFCKVLLAVVVAVFGILALSGVLFAQGRSADAFERVAEVQEKHTEVLMARPGVVGTAVGLNDDGQHVVLVLLEKSGVGGIPKALDGVPVRVMVTGKIHALADPTVRFDRPVPIGVSTGHPDITAGTIGCRVKDSAGNIYALSNNHVYANENLATADVVNGDPVLQPGPYDGGSSPVDYIGTLAAYVDIVFSESANNVIDAAIAASSETLLGNATPLDDGYGVPKSTTIDPALRMTVQKYGRTTGLTSAKIAGINATVRVGYDSGVARFVGQIVIRGGGFSAGGDSGSLIVTNYPDDPEKDRKPVGLLFAGGASTTIANPIDAVLDAFGVTIDDSPEGPINNVPIVTITSPVDGDTFDSGATISFAGTASDAEDGDLTTSLVWTSSIDGPIGGGGGGSFSSTLSDGNHTITATVTDSGSKTASTSISITVRTPSSGTMYVQGITFDSKVAGPNKFLYTTVKVLDDSDNLLEGVRVEMTLKHVLGPWFFAGDTGSDGTVKFTLLKAPSGSYTATVTNIPDGVISASYEL